MIYVSYHKRGIKGFTRNTLDEICHHRTEMGSNVFKHVQLLLILSLQKHPGQIHILQEQGTQCQGVTLQCSVGAADKEKESFSLQKPSFMFDKESYMCILTATGCKRVWVLPVTDNPCVGQQFKNPQQLQPEKIPPFSAFLVLKTQTDKLYISSTNNPWVHFHEL